MLSLSNKERKRLRNLDFRYIEHVQGGLYKVRKAKDMADDETTTAHVVDDDRVCFFSHEHPDHGLCIDMKHILRV